MVWSCVSLALLSEASLPRPAGGVLSHLATCGSLRSTAFIKQLLSTCLISDPRDTALKMVDAPFELVNLVWFISVFSVLPFAVETVSWQARPLREGRDHCV